MKRTDLLELTPEALTALANAGFVKRAQKELADGPLPDLQETNDGTLSARFSDGTVSSLSPKASLRDATCSCPASGMCRHRVMLVLAYQIHARNQAAPDNAQPEAQKSTVATGAVIPADEHNDDWTPAIFESVVATFPAATLKQATMLASACPVVQLTAWRSGTSIPNARLPMCNVRFFSRSNVAHARCDCKQGSGCAHIVVAVWAFVQARQHQPGFATLSLEVVPPQEHATETNASLSKINNNDETRLRNLLDSLCLLLWLEGTRQSLLALEARFEHAIACADQLEWLWVSETLHDLRNGIHALQARSNRAEPLAILKMVVHLHARTQAARYSNQQTSRGIPALPARQILGIGIKGEVALDHLRLVSLGAQTWADMHEEGASLLFVDPDTLAVTLIERSWPLAKSGEPHTTLRDRRVAGQPLRALASSQIVTKAAIRRANGRLEIMAGARNTSVMPLSPRAWDHIGAPIRQTNAVALKQHLLHTVPPFVSPRQAVEHLHIVPVARVIDWGWDAAQQILFADVLTGAVGEPAIESGSDDERMRTITLILRHDVLSPHAVDAVACVMSGQWGALISIAGVVRLDAMQLQLEPLALLTTQRAVIPAFENVEKQNLPIKALPFVGSPLMTLIRDTQALLALWLRQGLRHQGAHAFRQGETQAGKLAEAGLSQCAHLLRQALQNWTASDPTGLPGILASLVLLLEQLARNHVLGLESSCSP